MFIVRMEHHFLESVTIKTLSPKTLLAIQWYRPLENLIMEKRKRQQGVSIVRAGRELELGQGFNISKDPRNRWWGARSSSSAAWMTFWVKTTAAR